MQQQMNIARYIRLSLSDLAAGALARRSCLVGAVQSLEGGHVCSCPPSACVVQHAQGAVHISIPNNQAAVAQRV